MPSAARALSEVALEIQFRDGRVPTLVARRRAEAGPSGARPASRGACCRPGGEAPIRRLLQVMARLRAIPSAAVRGTSSRISRASPCTIEEA